MINPEDSDGGGGLIEEDEPDELVGSPSTIGSTIRLLRNPSRVVVDANNTITAGFVRDGIHTGDSVYINDSGWITGEKPDGLASIIGVVVGVDNNNVEINIESSVEILYNHVVDHSGGIITEGGSFDPKRTIGYNEEEHQSEKLKTVKEATLERKDGMRKDGAVRTTIDEDLMNALLED